VVGGWVSSRHISDKRALPAVFWEKFHLFSLQFH
jgi:hypothetical protein